MTQTVDLTDEQIDALWGRYDQGHDTRRALVERILSAALSHLSAEGWQNARRYEWLRANRCTAVEAMALHAYQSDAHMDAAIDAMLEPEVKT